MKLIPTFRGMVDTFHDGIAHGWALDERRPSDPVSVDLYVDGERAASVVANLPRPDLEHVSPASTLKGYRLDCLQPQYHPKSFAPRLELYFGNSMERITVSKSAARFLNRPVIDFEQLASIGYSEWTPTPPSDLVRYITGATASDEEQRKRYLRSGAENAADLYNILLDLGLDTSKPDFTIIDLGCGTGRYAPFLKQYIPQCKYFGLDVHMEAITWARNTITRIDKDLEFTLLHGSQKYMGQDAFDLPNDAKQADAVIAMSLFTHLAPAASKKYFSEICRVLSRDGVGLVSFRLLYDDAKKQTETEAQRVKLHLVKDGDTWWYGRDGYLDIFYTPVAVANLARAAGLEIIAIRRGSWYRPGSNGITPPAYQDLVIVRIARDGTDGSDAALAAAGLDVQTDG